MHNVGFSGPRRGLTDFQEQTLWALLRGPDICTVHHGGTQGADERFHELALKRGHSVVLHPPEREALRGVFDGVVEEREPLYYTDRMKSIVQASNYLIACPDSRVERARNGVWATVRMAHRFGLKLILVFPNGDISRAD